MALTSDDNKDEDKYLHAPLYILSHELEPKSPPRVYEVCREETLSILAMSCLAGGSWEKRSSDSAHPWGDASSSDRESGSAILMWEKPEPLLWALLIGVRRLCGAQHYHFLHSCVADS